AAVVLARALSLEDYGLVNVAIAIAGILFVACGLGLPETGSRDASVARARAAVIADRVLGGRLLVLGALSFVALAVVLVAAPDDVWVVAFAVAMALALAWSLEWLLRGLERMGSVAVANAAGGAVVLAGAVLITATRPTVPSALAVFVVGELTVALLTLRAARLPRLPRPRIRGLRTATRRSWPLGASALVVYSYYANLDTILLSVTRSAQEAGLYSAPYRLFLALNVLGTFAAYALLPRIARAVEAGAAADAIARAGLQRALMPLAGYGLLVLGAVEIAGEDMLRLLFGGRFAGQGDVFLVLCVAVPWFSVAFPVGYALIARDANRRFFAGAAVAGVLNLVLNAVLIPLFGPIGAAVATAVALVAGSIVWLRAQDMFNRATATPIALVAAATLAAPAALAGSAVALGIGALTLAAGIIAVAAGARSWDG
ncbi:MAG: oligosaccharide flippase family protein, partial [Solirubrobacteraceae bacterium]|nr:oligosaccharide flippase family protein [Solirubrobacteraceae bacterium]